MDDSVIQLTEVHATAFTDDHHCQSHQLSSYIQAEEPNDSISSRQSRRPTLALLQIPARTVDNVRTDNPTLSSSPYSAKAGLPPRSCSTGFRSSMRNILPQRNSSTKTSVISDDTGEKSVLIFPTTPKSDTRTICDDKPCTSRSFSLKHVFSSPSTKRACSLPVSPFANSCSDNASSKLEEERNVTVVVDDDNRHDQNASYQDAQLLMKRSSSVPVKLKNPSMKRLGSTGCVMIRVVSQHVVEVDNSLTTDGTVSDNDKEETIEDIPEEEAVCRICLIELSEGGDAFKLECSCKGELALSHKECAVKWFTIKGNKICDVCHHDVKNLPVTLLRVQSHQTASQQQRQRRVQSTTVQEPHTDASSYRVWQDIPILVIVSMLAYFCLLEQLLISDLGPRALAVSLPSACVLGLLSSMIASTMVSKGYIWAYASFQFSIVVLFAHIFYTLLKVNPLLSILLASFTGFGIAISTNALIVEYLRWRTSSAQPSPRNQVNISSSRNPRQQHHRNHHHHHHHVDVHRFQHPMHQNPLHVQVVMNPET